MKKLLLPILILFSAQAFATTWLVQTSGSTFVPDSITITQGDTVNFFQLGFIHNAAEVSQATWDINDNTPLGGGFSTPFNGGLVTGLTVGTHYYVCDNHFGSGMKGRIFVEAAGQPVVIPNVWINEIHYDNAGADTAEGYEIAGPAGTDLSCFRVFFYNGVNGQHYGTDNLSGTIPDLGCGFGTVWFASAGIQNGDAFQNEPDGIVLEYAPTALSCGVNNQDTIIQFLSYEGSFTATDGRAMGLTSMDIVFSESPNTPIGSSLQLGGAGTSYFEFAWNTPAASTYDAVNTGQFFCGVPLASYSFNPVSATFSESAGTVVAGYVKASNVFIQSQSVDVVLKTGSAADIDNYTTQTLTFNPGGIDSLPLNITITDDALVEATENIVFALRDPSNSGTIEADSLYTLTITDNDVAPNPSVEFVLTSSSNSEGVTSFQLAVSIASPNSNPTSVDINVLGGGTATSGVDYTFSPLTVTFPANSTFAQFVTVNIADDIIVEGNETFTFQLNFPTNNATIGANSQHVVTIVDNDVLRFDISPPSQTVNENAGVVSVSVSLSSLSTNATSVTVHLEPAGTTATQGSDFFFNDTTLTWPAGSTGPISFPITVADDTLVEPDETAKLVLVNPTNGASFLNDTFQLTILNNDTAPVPPAVVHFIALTNTVVESAGAVPVIVQIDNPSALPVSFFVVRDNVLSTAVVGQDYNFTNPQLVTNTGGTTFDTVFVNVIDEQLIESTESVYLHFINFSPNTITLPDSTFTLYIIDNDTLTASFNGAGFGYVEGDTLVRVRVTISTFPDDTTTVSISLAPGSATNGTDFVFSDTIITFLPGSIDTQSVLVLLKEDALVEVNEQINFNITGTTNGAHVAISAYTLTIIDNDQPIGMDEAGFENGLKMFPNPVMNTLFVETENELQDLEVTDLLGNVVMKTGALLSGRNSIDVSMLTSGMYFVNMHDGHKLLSKRFVKQD